MTVLAVQYSVIPLSARDVMDRAISPQPLRCVARLWLRRCPAPPLLSSWARRCWADAEPTADWGRVAYAASRAVLVDLSPLPHWPPVLPKIRPMHPPLTQPETQRPALMAVVSPLTNPRPRLPLQRVGRLASSTLHPMTLHRHRLPVGRISTRPTLSQRCIAHTAAQVIGLHAFD